jgi:hypothetical protein
MAEADRPLRRAEVADRIQRLRRERAELQAQTAAEPDSEEDHKPASLPTATTAAERIAQMLRSE